MKRPHPGPSSAFATLEELQKGAVNITDPIQIASQCKYGDEGATKLEKRKPLVIVIAGPTGVGKSDVAALLCKASMAKRILQSVLLDDNVNESFDVGDQSRSFVGEMVSADSVQAYEGVSIGANKPTEEERKATRYHLIDVVPAASVATQPYSAATWMQDALGIIDTLTSSTKETLNFAERTSATRTDDLEKITSNAFTLPVVVGGTMMYVQWLVHGRPNAPRPSNEVVHLALSKIAEFQTKISDDNEVEGTGRWDDAKEFVSNLGDVFRQRVSQLERNDWYRLRRVYEIALTASEGKAMTEDSNPPTSGVDMANVFNDDRDEGLCYDERYDVRCFFLCPSQRMDHAKVIDLRCEQMLLKGLLEETTRLHIEGQLPPDSQPARAIGYRQALEYLLRPNPVKGDVNAFDTFVDQFMSATRQYAKKQMQWFRRDEQFIFIPVPTTDGATMTKEERNIKTAETIANLCIMPRAAYDEELFMPSRGTESTESGISLSAQTKRANESQGKKMKLFLSQRQLLKTGSQTLSEMIEKADECTAQIQSSMLSTDTPNTS